jgi:uncharacterized protein YeaO (DUF488 family)
MRFLVDRLWPRGVAKRPGLFDSWLKDVAPSDPLRRWFGHKPERWEDFKRRYFAELREKPGVWKLILNATRRGEVTLLYGAKDPEHNNAVALKQFLARRRSTRTGKGRSIGPKLK